MWSSLMRMRSGVLRSATSDTRLTAASRSAVLTRTETVASTSMRWRTFGNAWLSRRVVASRVPLELCPMKPARPSPSASVVESEMVTLSPEVMDLAVSASTLPGTRTAPSTDGDDGCQVSSLSAMR